MLEDQIMEIADRIIHSHLLQAEDIPKIDLYMEQTISFLEQEMGDTLRRKDEVVFTKTMVNNYTKFGILPRPDKKKYNREHIISLIYIFLLKQILSIQDIKSFFSLLPENEEGEKSQIESLYLIFREMSQEIQLDITEFVEKHLERIREKFETYGIEDEKLKTMSFISIMALEANINKMICSQLLDTFAQQQPGKEEKEKDKGKAKGEET